MQRTPPAPKDRSDPKRATYNSSGTLFQGSLPPHGNTKGAKSNPTTTAGVRGIAPTKTTAGATGRMAHNHPTTSATTRTTGGMTQNQPSISTTAGTAGRTTQNQPVTSTAAGTTAGTVSSHPTTSSTADPPLLQIQDSMDDVPPLIGFDTNLRATDAGAEVQQPAVTQPGTDPGTQQQNLLPPLPPSRTNTPASSPTSQRRLQAQMQGYDETPITNRRDLDLTSREEGPPLTEEQILAAMGLMNRHVNELEHSENWRERYHIIGPQIAGKLHYLKDHAKCLRASGLVTTIRELALRLEGIMSHFRTLESTPSDLLQPGELSDLEGDLTGISGQTADTETADINSENLRSTKIRTLTDHLRKLTDTKANKEFVTTKVAELESRVAETLKAFTQVADLEGLTQKLENLEVEFTRLSNRVGDLEKESNRRESQGGNDDIIRQHAIMIDDVNKDTGEISIRLRKLEQALRNTSQQPTPAPDPPPPATTAGDDILDPSDLQHLLNSYAQAPSFAITTNTNLLYTSTVGNLRPLTSGTSTALTRLTSTSRHPMVSQSVENSGRTDLPDQAEEHRPESLDGSESESISIQQSANPFATRLERKILNSVKQLESLLTPKIDDSLTKSDILNLHKSSLPEINRDMDKLDELLNSYQKTAGNLANLSSINKGEIMVNQAAVWKKALMNKFNTLDCGNKSLDPKLFSDLKKFSEHTEISIYEHLSKFDQIVADNGSKRERAALLYSKYLDEGVQRKCVELRDDFDKLKDFLYRRYGDPRTMCINITKNITDSPPDDTAISQNLVDHYRILEAAIKRINELFKLPTVSQEQLTSYVYSCEFLGRLVTFLPFRARNEFYDQLAVRGLDYLNIQGQIVYSMLERIVSRYANVMEGMHLIDPSAKKRTKGPPTKQVKHTVVEPVAADEVSDSDTSESKKSAKKKGKKQAHATAAPNTSKDSKQNSKPKNLKFPCPFAGHKHEVGTCKDFMIARPETRRTISKGKLCWRCVGPFSTCNRDCKTSVPSALICEDCTEYGKTKGFGPTNNLFCLREEHRQKIDITGYAKALEGYLTGFKADKHDAKKLVGIHLTHLSAYADCSDCAPKKCQCHALTRTRKPDPSQEIQCIDSESGELQDVDPSKIVKETKEDCFYVMQIMNILGQDVLTFFDSGANHNLICGRIGEDVGMKVLTDMPVNVGMVGGGKIWTEYGSYKFCLGPTEDGEYHEVTAQGISHITSTFNRYDLTEINKEVRKTNKLPKGTTFPQLIGGMEAGLLIGINTCGLEPILQFRLPSGLGVYQSPLKDKFGSRVCYGGPHSVFTNINKEAGKNSNHVQVFFTEMVNQYRYSPYVTLSHNLKREYEEQLPGFLTPKNTPQIPKLQFHDTCHLSKSPLDETDYQDMGYPQVFNPQDPLDYRSEECSCIHVCRENSEPRNVHGSIVEAESAIDPVKTSICVNKAKISVSKLKGYIDENDLDHGFSPRCENCKLCTKCGTSTKSRMISLQEQVEQQAINDSVKIDLNEKKVYVDLPFIKAPIPHLKKRHFGKDSNYQQALRMMQSCCRKPLEVRESLVRVHQELIDKGFMKKLSDLPAEQQTIISSAGFRHYMPWNVAHKPDSASTPHRITVDASITGLNEILAKGENQLSQIPDILVRNRCRKFIWSSDVSKLYNQLVLTDDALPYGLFLFCDNLDLKNDPVTYVMTVAWYGVTSTGNQAAVALNRLTETLIDKYPRARKVIASDLYVDDIMSGDNCKDILGEQITQTVDCLAQGGFALKFVVKSGEPPAEEAGTTEPTLRVLGYKWETEADNLMCGFKEINFNKKRRGAKPSNPFQISTHEDLTKLLGGITITRRVIMSKMAEMYDPCGFWEPYKLQLKLDNTLLKGLDWDTPVTEEIASKWTKRFHEFLELPNLSAPRCVVPPDAVDPNKVRLLCVADAATEAGGTAIYAGFEKKDGTFSCSLLMAKSKIMNQSVPRNELEAIRIMTDLAQAALKSLDGKVSEILYFTDSQVALCWCSNTTKKLRLYVLFRVAEIRRNILGNVHSHEQYDLPLFHIDGKVNPADLLTKPHDLTPDNLHSGSIWQSGYPWMSLPSDKIQTIKYTDLKLSKETQDEINQECFPEPILTGNHLAHSSVPKTGHHCEGCPEDIVSTPTDICFGHNDQHCDHCSCSTSHSSFFSKRDGAPHSKVHLVDIVKYGWKKTLNIYANIFNFILNLKHKVHASKGIMPDKDCKICHAAPEVRALSELQKLYLHSSEEYLYAQESEEVMKTLSPKKLEQYIIKDNRVYYESRLVSETISKDIDVSALPFFDNFQIKPLLPVVRAESELFFALAIHIHLNVRPHSGVETSFREICQAIWPINNPRKYLQRIRKDCSRCRIIAKKTLELRMLNHPAARNTIAPPFYISQMDTVFGFSAQLFKNARRVVKIYALIICCLFTGATNILAIESLSTRDVLQALERHAARYGVPSILFVDNGTQLIALENATFNLCDFKAQTFDAHNIQVKVSNAKAHEERGRIEARVRIMRKMLDKLAINSSSSLTFLQWETVFSKVSSEMNDLPIAKPSKSNHLDPLWDIITPNRLLLGRNNNRNLKGWFNLSKGSDSEALLRKNQEIMKAWYSIFHDHIHLLIPRPAKWLRTDPVNVGDVVLFLANETPGSKSDHWKLGLIKDIPKKNSLTIEYTIGGKSRKTLNRCPRDVCVIAAADELSMNSTEYFRSLVDS